MLRLIEQGLEQALLVRSLKKFTLPSAQKMENKLADELGINQRLHKNSSYTNLVQLEQKVKELYKEIKTESFPRLLKAGLFSPWLELYEAKKLFKDTSLQEIKGGKTISGKILATWGKESLLKTTEGIIKINRNELLGRKLEPLQECIYEEE